MKPTPASTAGTLPDDLVASMLEAVAPAGSDPAALQRVRSSLMRQAAQTGAGGTNTIRSQDKAWQSCGRGVERMIVVGDGSHHSWLLRLAPGASLPAHHHMHGDEESIVLQGSCLVNGELLVAGDVHLADHGSRHDKLVSEAGCLLWLRMPAGQAREMSAFALGARSAT